MTRADTPVFCERFESWFEVVDRTRLERLHRAREVGLEYRKDDLQAFNDNTIDPAR